MDKKIFKAREGSPFKNEDAREIGEFFERYNGRTTRELLEIIRKNKNLKVYQYIEWDDKIASEQFRLYQVRNIINHIVVEIVGITNEPPLRLIFSVQEKPNETKKVHVTYETIFSNEFYKKQVIDRALSELKNWTDRYYQYQELSNLINIIDDELSKIIGGTIPA